MISLANYTIDDKLSIDVNRGIFTPNKFPREIYEDAGFRCDYHFFSKDEFIMNGSVYNVDDANAIMDSLGYVIEEKIYENGRKVRVYKCKDRVLLEVGQGRSY